MSTVLQSATPLPVKTAILALVASTAAVNMTAAASAAAPASVPASVSVSGPVPASALGPVHAFTDRFVASLTTPVVQDFARLLCRLETAAPGTWHKVTPWHQCIDRYYSTPAHRWVRTTTTAGDSLSVEHVYDVPLACIPIPSAFGSIRLSTHRTRPLAVAELQDRVDATARTCIRQVRTFTRTAVKSGITWTVEVCQFWESEQLTQTLLALRNGDPPRMRVTLSASGLAQHSKRIGIAHVVADSLCKLEDVFKITTADGNAADGNTADADVTDAGATVTVTDATATATAADTDATTATQFCFSATKPVIQIITENAPYCVPFAASLPAEWVPGDVATPPSLPEPIVASTRVQSKAAVAAAQCIAGDTAVILHLGFPTITLHNAWLHFIPCPSECANGMVTRRRHRTQPRHGALCQALRGLGRLSRHIPRHCCRGLRLEYCKMQQQRQ